MSGLNLPSPKNLFGYSPRNNQPFGIRQPLYLQPNSPFMSPKGGRLSSPRNNTGSPDFIPLGISSPVGRARHSWKNHNHSNNSYNSNSSTPPSSSNSSFNSPYRRTNYRGNFSRGRNSYNNSGPSSPHISLYVSRDMLEDPWAELEKKLEDVQKHGNRITTRNSEDTHNSTVTHESDSESNDVS